LAQNDKLNGLIYVNMAAGQEKFVSFRSKSYEFEAHDGPLGRLPFLFDRWG
jgi:hypothetical protein